MRKVAFTSGQDGVRKVMLYECSDGVYVFGYDCLQDSSSISDYFQDTVEAAEDFCKNTYNIETYNWILIADPLDNCQHDFILPTKLKGKENGNPEWGHFQTLVDNSWLNNGLSNKTQSFGGMTVKERLFVSGLIDEFDKSKISDKMKAKQILRSLQVDELTIELIIK
jgi:hypothetical protein